MLKSRIGRVGTTMLFAVSLFGQTNPGGSNFAWYGPAGTQCFSPDCYAPYGVFPNYDVAASAIDDALSQMYANGQRSLRIPIYYQDGNGSTNCTGPEGRGTTMDSTGGSLATQYVWRTLPIC